jgi:ABC-type bacteriocin/lantibiotic exporter with double-glycine peptidase domain
MTGNRLGIVVETVVMFVLGLVLGSLFSWQLTLIVFGFNLIVFFLAYMEIQSHAKLTERTGVILRRASSVRSRFT